MIIFVIFLLLLILVVALTFLLGFRVGGDRWSSELARVQTEAMDAQRQMHDLTREAFIAMAEHVDHERLRRSP